MQFVADNKEQRTSDMRLICSFMKILGDSSYLATHKTIGIPLNPVK